MRADNYPFHLDVNDIPGIEVVRTDGALIAHIERVDDHIDRLQYPCRCDAMIAILCMRGKVQFSAHLADYELTPGMVFISCSTILEFRHSEDCELYAVILTPSFVDDMLPDKRLLIPAIVSIHCQCRLASVEQEELEHADASFATIYRVYGGGCDNRLHELSLRHFICAMLYRLCSGMADVDMRSCDTKDRSADHFERFMYLLAEHFREQRGVEFYADKMHVSAKHLSRVIRNYTGKSVHQWIDDFVALEIKNLLRYSSLSVQQISYKLNFPNPSFMGQYFKRITGMTPGQYKRL